MVFKTWESKVIKIITNFFVALFVAILATSNAQAAISLSDFEINEQLEVTINSSRFNRRTNETSYSVSITNKSPESVIGPVYLTIQNINQPSVTVTAPLSEEGIPVVSVDAPSIAPQESVATTVVFQNSLRQRFSFDSFVYASKNNAQTTLDVFLKIDGLKGESQVKTHKDEIDVLKWNWGMFKSRTSQAGVSAGKANVQDITITKWVDKTSPNLMKSSLTGEHFKEVRLLIRKGDTPYRYVVLTMQEVLVTKVEWSGTYKEDRPTENISLNFAKFKYEYYQQKEDGSWGAAVEIHFDIQNNEEI